MNLALYSILETRNRLYYALNRSVHRNLNVSEDRKTQNLKQAILSVPSPYFKGYNLENGVYFLKVNQICHWTKHILKSTNLNASEKVPS